MSPSVSETLTGTPTQNAHALAAELSARRLKRLAQEATKAPWKPRRIYASGLSSCDRQMVYAFTAWDQKEPFAPEGVAAMQDGQMEEQIIVRELSSDGFPPVETQVSMDDDRLWLTGKIDGKIMWNGRKVPFEIKRLKPFAFDRVKTFEDLKANPFLMKYLRQLTAYLYLHNEEAGLFILSDGCGKRAYLVVELDMAFAETEVVQRCERVKAALNRIERLSASVGGQWPGDQYLPDRIPYDSKVCGFCSWKTTCLPQVNFGEGAHMAEPELAEKLKRHLELKPLVAEADRLKQEIKAVVEGKEITLAGGYVVTGKQVTVTPKPPTTPPKPYSFWKWEVQALETPETVKAQ
ncbi:MAG: hypothetical protein Q8R91_02715 [Candidatus Omnitrophota bacterium]|nr:hypothetical protein [Candidatus Omnitrophota bacterium]